MLYGEIKRRISAELRSDRSYSDPQLSDAVYDAICDTAKRCVPLSLVSQGNSEALFRWIDNVSYIRIPAVPTGSDEDKIDIDNLLCLAVVYGACFFLSRDNKADYLKLQLSEINKYEWAIFEGESNAVS